jgi:uncharacterized protein (DUF1015 family)
MATVYPFKGYRYDANRVGQVRDVVTQPYDKIPDTLREEYLQRHPNNFVRVIKNPNYEEAAGFMDQWIDQGILARDSEPALYVYEQVFAFEEESFSRLGFIGLVSLEDEDLVVRGHERVLDRPLEDRLNLIRRTHANEGLVFTLYSDTELKVDALLREYSERGDPVYEFEDDFGVLNKLWKLDDADHTGEIGEILKGKALYIADGHHRFRTSEVFHEECLAKGWKCATPESFDKRLVALFNMESEGVRILATHRAVSGLPNFDSEGLVQNLREWFEVVQCGSEGEMLRALPKGAHQLGMVISASPLRAYLLRMKLGAAEDPAFMPGLEGPSRGLDVSLLHDGILKPYLGLGPEEVASQKYIDYFRESSAMVSALREGRFQLGFFLNPTSLQQVREVSEAGERMPQKSTDFYPKRLTCLVFMKMDIEG